MKYIPLDALVAEIERRFDEYSSSILKHYDACKEARAQELGKILTIIGTIEVKEMGVDLGDPKGDKSAKYIIDTKNLEVKEVDLKKEYDNEFFKDPVFGKLVNRNAGISIAKHFFELGLKVRQQ